MQHTGKANGKAEAGLQFLLNGINKLTRRESPNGVGEKSKHTWADRGA